MLFNAQSLTEAVAASTNMTDCLSLLGLPPKRGYYDLAYNKIKFLCLDLNHWSPDKSTKPRATPKTKPELSDILSENGPYRDRRGCVKALILKHGLLEHLCSECGIGDEWNHKQITLQLDHVNGVNTDHRIENLRFLCPNCHSQTHTFSGRNSRRKDYPMCNTCQTKLARGNVTGYCQKHYREHDKRLRRPKPVRTIPWAKVYNEKTGSCADCTSPISKGSERCSACARKQRIGKTLTWTQWPELAELELLVDKLGFSATGRQLGVSDNAIRKHIRVAKKRMQSQI